MSRWTDGLRAMLTRQPAAQAATNTVTVDSLGFSNPLDALRSGDAMRLADVNRCVEILSDDMAKLPWYAFDRNTREHPEMGELLRLLNVRPNEGFKPFVMEKLVQSSVLLQGNGYIWLVRQGWTAGPVTELIPVPGSLVTPHRSDKGRVWYEVQHPMTGEPMRLFGEDMVHLKGFSYDGLVGVSVLSRAADVTMAGAASQAYQTAFYANGGKPSGVLETEADLGGTMPVTANGETRQVAIKDVLRADWEKIHSGPNNAHRIAILDHGLKYTPINVSQRDAQFVESKAMSRIDIANFFGVPLYKLNDGKQAYASNDQNNTDYAVSTLQPKVTQWEQEVSYKLLTDSQLGRGLWLRKNMMAVLRGDMAARATWYQTMLQEGPYSVNDVRQLEDLPDVPGGDQRRASLNYVPLEDFKRLSEQKKGGN